MASAVILARQENERMTLSGCQLQKSEAHRATGAVSAIGKCGN
jgi:hypothetical protein